MGGTGVLAVGSVGVVGPSAGAGGSTSTNSPRVVSGRDTGSRRNRSASRQSGGSRRRPKPIDGIAMGSDYTSSSKPSEGQTLPQIGGSGSGAAGGTGASGLTMPSIGQSTGTSANPPIVSSSQTRRAQQMLQQQQSGLKDNGSLVITTEETSTSSVTSIKGLKPGNPNWTNQDNFIVLENMDNRDYSIFCVLDGHGEHGHLVSRKCRENFPNHIRASSLDMRRAFSMMQNDLMSCDFDVRCSGATCVMAIVSGGRLAVSNCGDSRAVLGRRSPSGAIIAHALTSDHKPDKPEERKRILGCGGHLGCRHVVVNQNGKGPTSVPVGPCRVWYQHRGETLGLAMSRSLGDSIVHKCGVSAEPETLEHTLDEQDEFMVVATDGVWDVMENQQVVQMISAGIGKNPNWSTAEAANTIARFARARWEKLSPMVDDITCIVIKLRG